MHVLKVAVYNLGAVWHVFNGATTVLRYEKLSDAAAVVSYLNGGPAPSNIDELLKLGDV
jgi:hypothetical protein